MGSIWQRGVEMPRRAALNEDIEADVCVIGAGMAGLNCAAHLRRAGLSVAVLEAARVGGGVTAGTTAKITAQHGLIYDYLARTFGARAAHLYAEANIAALEDYAQTVEREKIDCDFARADSFVYALRDAWELEEECEAMRAAGLDASLAEPTELPFPTVGAVRLSDQAHFHPLKYLRALAEGLDIYENSRALSVEDGDGGDGRVVRTPGGSVAARDVVVATHFPFVDTPGYYFLRMRQDRSAVAALEGAQSPRGMYVDAEDGGLSLRPQGEWLLLGAGSWRTGRAPRDPFAALRKAEALFPGAREADIWAAQDCMTRDRVPYIGRYSASAPRLWVATGFGKWGMTSSMVAARLLTDLILGHANAAAALFSPQRRLSRGLGSLAVDAGETVRGLALRAAPEQTPACTHMGCALARNAGEGTWECPCHGSRFDESGHVLDGPAQRDLEIQPPQHS